MISLIDCITDLDVLPDRQILDTQKNGHGKSFIEFLKDSKLCIVNGRVNPECDNYTFLSSRGKSVVDHFCVPHECLKFCVDFQILIMSDVIDTSCLIYCQNLVKLQIIPSYLLVLICHL